ncbi:NUDIX hydrolase [Teichococcus aestuarii]|uniref:hypothetical protein n=1 Tax=Teichococcus aestuarii TaxID=568898 RepID=UPI003607CBEB
MPTLDRLHYLCRAVTPARSPIRFNARFLVAPAEAAEGTLSGSGELEQLAWLPLEGCWRCRWRRSPRGCWASSAIGWRCRRRRAPPGR